MMEALSSSETSVLTRATRRNIPEDAIIHSHRSENLKFINTHVRFEVFTAMTMKNAVFWDVSPTFFMPILFFTTITLYHVL
jgi:hypothetical protein